MLIYTATYAVFGNILSQWFSTWQIVTCAIGFFVIVHLVFKLISRVRARKEKEDISPPKSATP
ncbi:hypothetical protein IV102_21840 [bacterium]|nr:hypothetical protein [bacterium]